VTLLEKGVGIHHSGMIPVLREIVEFMISKKYIRILFATESFAIGLDCPIKTAIFINLKKHDGGEQPRYILSHEYTQMAGRAGRRGIDTVGHVIHCGNLFEQPDIITYKEILSGKPQKLVSKFQIYYPVVLNVFKTSKQVLVEEIEAFVNHSMYKSELDSIQRGLLDEYEQIEEKVTAKHNGFASLKTSRDVLDTYNKMLEKSQFCANKKRKEIDAQIKELKTANTNLEKDFAYDRIALRLRLILFR
jgi:antiviral helicase SKI2